MRRQGRQSQLNQNTSLVLCDTNSNTTYSVSPLLSSPICQEIHTSLICDSHISSTTNCISVSSNENMTTVSSEYDILDDFTTVLEEEYDIIDVSVENIPLAPVLCF